jgi:hypothetical protein
VQEPLTRTPCSSSPTSLPPEGRQVVVATAVTTRQDPVFAATRGGERKGWEVGAGEVEERKEEQEGAQEGSTEVEQRGRKGLEVEVDREATGSEKKAHAKLFWKIPQRC